MNLYTPKQLANSMRVVRKNTILIAEDIPEAQYDYRPAPDSRSVRETLLHMASMTLFDLHIHEEQKLTSMEGFDLRGLDRKSTRLNSSHSQISYAVFCLKKKKKNTHHD